MLGYLARSEENRDLRRATLTSHVQVLRDYPPAPSGSDILDTVLEQLQKTSESLWSRWIPKMIGGYFGDLTAVLDQILSSLLEGGQCWMVVGDSRYSGITVSVARILAELAQHRRWAINRCEPIRHMKSSAQQGWRPELAETLIVLENITRPSDSAREGAVAPSSAAN